MRSLWHGHVAWFAFAAATFYAITDEFHQSFVPNRQGHVADVLIDSGGAALGLAGMWLFSRWRSGRPKNHHRAPSGR